ncbi:MAG: Iron-sulfur cluster insertion protein ErpA [ANME-2 cluster archaeon HR1]|jgi:iron-sulfur cluster assembly protein|nr:MAG: iron-sulfur cluster assembly protein [ANME-2 cluster archaeon]KAF5428142.1 iron-sulfur cluster assembly protein [ANME-2 cluster archaeon]PPA79375.1 MAG: Iron-sulfur cluster insertion protein ErpA [ANME-2 cluster archaeon HR1]
MVEVTEPAVVELKSLLKKGNKNHCALRIYLSDIEYNGIRHGISLTDTKKENDEEITINGIRIFLSPTMLNTLENAKIDFIDSEIGRGFVIKNQKPSEWNCCCSC